MYGTKNIKFEQLFVVFCSNDEGYFYIHPNLAVFCTFGANEIQTPLTGNGERIESKNCRLENSEICLSNTSK
jgi:hypothetical protein